MHSLLVSELMDPQPLTIGPNIGVIVAMRKLLIRNVTGCSVVDEQGNLIGYLSEADCMPGKKGREL